MNSRKSLYDIKSFYDAGAKLKASFKGMRYQIEGACGHDGRTIRLSVWPEPFCYEKTPDELKIVENFIYGEDGLDMAYERLCQLYEEEKERWDEAKNGGLGGNV